MSLFNQDKFREESCKEITLNCNFKKKIYKLFFRLANKHEKYFYTQISITQNIKIIDVKYSVEPNLLEEIKGVKVREKIPKREKCRP